MKKAPPRVGAALGLVLLFTTFCSAQTGTGQISGTVEDATGGAIAGAAIKVTSTRTGVTRSAVSSSSGTFVVPSLAAAIYTVEVEYTGFRKYVVENVEVTVGADHALRVKLAPGTLTTQVEVKESAVQVQTSEASLSNLVDPKTVAQLPLNRRNPLHLLGLTPGVTGHSAEGTGSTGTVVHHVNGDRGRGVQTTLDGIDIGDPVIPRGELTNAPVNPDMLQEFRITTALARAEYGHNSGAQIEMSTKSGANVFHGNAYEFFRNTNLDANSFFNNQLNDPFTGRPPTSRERLQHNQFGGAMGGPILKKKLFFFGGYEGQRRQQSFLRSSNTLTTEARAGRFRYVRGSVTSGGKTYNRLDPALVDPATGVLRSDVFVCPSAQATNCLATYDVVANDPRGLGLDPSMRALINLYPSPNDFTASGDGLNVASFRWNAPASNPIDTYVARVDYNISSKYEFFSRYNLAWRSDLIGDFINTGLPRTPSTLPGRVRLSRQQSAAVGLKMIWSPTLVNDARLGFTRNKLDFSDPSHPIRTGDPVFSKVPELRTVSSTLDTPFIYWGGTGRFPELVQIKDNLSWQAGKLPFPLQKGAHLLRFGADIRFDRGNNFRNTGSNPGGSGISVFPSVFFTEGIVPFGGVQPANINATDATRLRTVSNELLGLVSTVDQAMYSDGKQYALDHGLVMYQRQREYSFYAQDDWRLTPRLMLNLGLRYELLGVPFDKGGLEVVPDRPLNQGPVSFLPAGPGTGRSWYQGSHNNFAPVLGFAWDPRGNGKTAIRGGYRINYNRLVGWALNVVEQRQPAIQQDPQIRGACWNANPAATALGPCPSNSQPGDAYVPFRLNELRYHPNVTVVNGLPNLNTPSPNVIQSTPSNSRLEAPFFFDNNFQTARVHQFSLSVQRQIVPNTVLEVGYVGNLGRNLFRFLNVNQLELRQNGFLTEFINAQKNLSICRATSGCTLRFSNQGLPGQVDLPIFTSLFTGSVTGPQTHPGFNNSTTIGQLDRNDVATLADRLDKGVPGTTIQSSLGPAAAGLPGGDRFFRPNPQFDFAGIGSSTSSSSYNSLQIQVRGNYQQGLQFAANYTFSKSLDDASDDTVGAGTAFDFPFDSKNPALNKARSNYDVTHSFRADAIYDLPFGHRRRFGQTWHPVLNQILGNWQVNTILDVSSGFPFTVGTNDNTSNSLNSFPLNYVTSDTIMPADCSPSAFGSGALNKADARGGVWFFGPGAVGSGTPLFTMPAPGTLGTCGRNTFVGPGFAQVDLGIFKSFAFSERWKLEFRSELFNAFNHANFNNPSSSNLSIQSNNFGKVTSIRAPNRVVQFALKLSF